MDDTVLNRVLEGQEAQAYEGSREGLQALDKAEAEGDLAAAFDELVDLLVGELHDTHAVLDVRRQEKVKGQDGRRLDQHEHEVVWLVHRIL